MSDVEFGPVDHATAGAVGEPGERIFMLQARSAGEVLTLVVEKEHVISLARAGHALLLQVGYPPERVSFTAEEMALDAGQEPLLRVATIGLGYDAERDLVLLSCEELVEEGEVARSVRIWMSRGQLAAMGAYGMTVVAKGRPICPLCTKPMDPEGHRCYAVNGAD